MRHSVENVTFKQIYFTLYFGSSAVPKISGDKAPEVSSQDDIVLENVYLRKPIKYFPTLNSPFSSILKHTANSPSL
jgi:hypothetical protein